MWKNEFVLWIALSEATCSLPKKRQQLPKVQNDLDEGERVMHKKNGSYGNRDVIARGFLEMLGAQATFAGRTRAGRMEGHFPCKIS